MKRNTTLATVLLLAALPLAVGAADAPAPPATKSAPAAPAAGAKDETASLFKGLDSNHDGYVTKDEAKRSADVTARFAELDADRDGKVAAAEFKKGMQPKQ